jgi:hypothetical protein
MIQIVVTRCYTNRIIWMKDTTVRIKCRPTFMGATSHMRCMGTAVMDGRDAEPAAHIDKMMRRTIGRRKQGHSVVETLKSGQWNWISLGEQMVWMKMGQVSIWSIAGIIQDILSR